MKLSYNYTYFGFVPGIKISIDDLFGQVRGATIFFKIDLRYAYHKLRIKDENIH